MNLIYARVSTDMQTTETQIKLCTKIAEQKGGETRLFVDEGVSTRKPMAKRPQLQAFLSEIHEDDLVIVYDLDRIGRSLIEGAIIYKQIKDLGAKITSVTNPNCDDPLTVHIKFAIAEDERRRISERTKHSMLVKRQKFERYGHIWYGYTLDPNLLETNKSSRAYGKPFKLIPEPNEQKVIQAMKEMYCQGLNYREIADQLTMNDWLTREGKAWQKNSVRRILMRELSNQSEIKNVHWTLQD